MGNHSGTAQRLVPHQRCSIGYTTFKFQRNGLHRVCEQHRRHRFNHVPNHRERTGTCAHEPLKLEPHTNRLRMEHLPGEQHGRRGRQLECFSRFARRSCVQPCKREHQWHTCGELDLPNLHHHGHQFRWFRHHAVRLDHRRTTGDSVLQPVRLQR